MIEVAELGRLFADYAWGIDHGRWELLAGTFAENASFGVSVAGEEVVPPIAGRAAIVDFISSTTIAQPDQRRHVITNVRPEGDGGAANLTLLVVENGQLEVKSCGYYTTTLVEEGGAWRFGDMRLFLDLGF